MYVLGDIVPRTKQIKINKPVNVTGDKSQYNKTETASGKQSTITNITMETHNAITSGGGRNCESNNLQKSSTRADLDTCTKRRTCDSGPAIRG